MYLFGETGLTALYNFIDRTTLVGFDLDGTLAPIVADANLIRVPHAIRKELLKLMEKSSVVIITGRSRSNALEHLGVMPHFLIGNHGAEGLPGREDEEAKVLNMARSWERQLSGLPSSVNGEGIVIENKGSTISVHYRASSDRKAARSLILSRIGLLFPKPRIISGKCVEDLIPATAPNKGEAFLYLMKRFGHAKGFYIGDDKTDEDVFRLTGEQLFTVRIGNARRSQAGYTLRSQQEVLHMLRLIVDALV